MSWISRVLGNRLHDEAAIQEALERALANVPGVTGHVVHFRSLAKGAGVVSGHVDVPDRAVFARALLAVAEVLGRDGGRVTVGLTGAAPDGHVIEAADLGLFVRPSGAHIRDHLGGSGV